MSGSFARVRSMSWVWFRCSSTASRVLPRARRAVPKNTEDSMELLVLAAGSSSFNLSDHC